MTKLKELTDAAVTVLDALNTRIENNVISRAATLKPQIVSLAKRIQDLISLVKKTLLAVEKAYGDIESPKTIVVEPLWSISVFDDRLVITRHKPKTITLSYSKSEGTVVVRAKDYSVELGSGVVKMGRLVLKLEVDPADADELAAKQNDIKYVLKEVIPEVELMSIAAEKKFAK